jgi:glycosyltransferase involved in cell wall biosynthesis
VIVQPKVSVIIPHYNRASLLTETVESVLKSTERDFEIIIVDDGSDSVEWAAVQRLVAGKVRVVRRNDGSKGPSRCRNLGVRESAAELLVFIDSDDIMAPWCLSTRLAAYDTNPDRDLWIFPVLLFKTRPGDLDVLWNLMESETDSSKRFLLSDPPWHTSSPLWRKSAFTSIGGFNEQLIYGDDSDLHYRALTAELRTATFPGLPDIFVRRSSASRITNSLTSELIASRLQRLRQGMIFLVASDASEEHRNIWEGQYFNEAEFLIFNGGQSSEIRAVVDAWIDDCSPSAIRRSLVKSYISIGWTCRDKAYVLLRIARRAAMLLLPREYFPVGGTFHQVKISATDMGTLRDRLGASRLTVSN